MSSLKDKKLFLLDMDGTIYLGDRIFDGTIDFLNYVKSIGGKYMFLTNNSSKSVEKYIEKLGKLGIKAVKDDFTTSAQATGLYLQKNNKDDLIYVFGTKSLKEELLLYGLNITDKLEDGINCLVMGFDTELTFQKLEDACILLNQGVDYIATNPDWVCPTEYGYVPDCGSVSTMLYNATKRLPKFIGKPEPTMVELAEIVFTLILRAVIMPVLILRLCLAENQLLTILRILISDRLSYMKISENYIMIL